MRHSANSNYSPRDTWQIFFGHFASSPNLITAQLSTMLLLKTSTKRSFFTQFEHFIPSIMAVPFLPIFDNVFKHIAFIASTFISANLYLRKKQEEKQCKQTSIAYKDLSKSLITSYGKLQITTENDQVIIGVNLSTCMDLISTIWSNVLNNKNKSDLSNIEAIALINCTLRMLNAMLSTLNSFNNLNITAEQKGNIIESFSNILIQNTKRNFSGKIIFTQQPSELIFLHTLKHIFIVNFAKEIAITQLATQATMILTTPSLNPDEEEKNDYTISIPKISPANEQMHRITSMINIYNNAGIFDLIPQSNAQLHNIALSIKNSLQTKVGLSQFLIFCASSILSLPIIQEYDLDGQKPWKVKLVLYPACFMAAMVIKNFISRINNQTTVFNNEYHALKKPLLLLIDNKFIEYQECTRSLIKVFNIISLTLDKQNALQDYGQHDTQILTLKMLNALSEFIINKDDYSAFVKCREDILSESLTRLIEEYSSTKLIDRLQHYTLKSKVLIEEIPNHHIIRALEHCCNQSLLPPERQAMIIG